MLKREYIGLAVGAILACSLTAKADIRSTIQGASSGTTVSCSGTYTVTSMITVPSGVKVSGGTFKFSSSCSAGFYIPPANHGATLTGITVQGAQVGIYVSGYGNTINSCTAQYNYNTGINLCGSAVKNNTVQYCVSKCNADSSGGNADGFGAKNSTSTGNKFVSCDSHQNSDDGFDFYSAASGITTSGSVAYNNGYYNGYKGDGDGFKMGGSGYSANHTFTSCTAYSNTAGNMAYGFDYNGNGGTIYLTSCKSYSNKNGNRLTHCTLSNCTMN
jgi:hypothetical protein